MKLRIRGNSIRLRLTQSEVAEFEATGKVEERTEFGSGQTFSYSLVRYDNGDRTHAEFDGGGIRVVLAEKEARRWTDSNQVGIEAVQPLGTDSQLRILIEKDFACLADRQGEEDANAFPNPRAAA